MIRDCKENGNSLQSQPIFSPNTLKFRFECKESPYSLHSPIFLCRITETAALFSGVGFQYPYVDRPQ